jgi:hypothetical protein
MLASHRWAGDTVWDLWGSQWHWDKFLSQSLWFCPVNCHSTIAPMLISHRSTRCAMAHLSHLQSLLWGLHPWRGNFRSHRMRASRPPKVVLCRGWEEPRNILEFWPWNPIHIISDCSNTGFGFSRYWRRSMLSVFSISVVLVTEIAEFLFSTFLLSLFFFVFASYITTQRTIQ